MLTFLAINAYTDFKKKKIYAVSVIGFIIIGVIIFIIKKDHEFFSLLGGLAIGLLVLIVSRLSSQAVGFGDGLIFLVTGVYLGFSRNLALLLYGLLICGVVSLVLVTFRKWKMKNEIPFVPFVFIAFILMIFLEV